MEWEYVVAMVVGWMARHGKRTCGEMGACFVLKTLEREVSHCPGRYAYVELDELNIPWTCIQHPERLLP